MQVMKKLLFVTPFLCLTIPGCTAPADVASYNLSRAADRFEILRRITFINGITDKYLLTIEGRCSLGNHDKAREISVTCKTGEGVFKKHFLGLSDNVTFVSEQLDAVGVSTFHYRIVFRPQTIIPNIEAEIER